MGGLARKATIIDQEKLDSSNVLVFDSGDLFFLEDTKHNDENRKIHAKIIAESYKNMGCNAISPGERDFKELGLSYLKELKDIGQLKFTSCNIYDSSKENRIFDEYGSATINGYNITFIGASSVFLNEELYIREPISDIKNTLSKVSIDSDFIILLFNGTEKDLDRIQESDLDIDMILYSRKDGKFNSRASTDGGKKRIPAITSGNRGKYMNKISVSINGESSEFVDLSAAESKIRSSKKYLDNKRKNAPGTDLHEIYKDNTQILKDIKYHESKISSSEKKINEAVQRFKTEKIALNEKVDSKPEVLLIVDSGMSKIIKGPPDSKGRDSSHPHHGHNHD